MTEIKPEGFKGAYLGGGLIDFSGKPSTRTRLHELGHKTLGHEPGRMPANEFAGKEIDAEIWAWTKMDKELNYKVGYPAYADLVTRFGLSPRSALRIVFSELLKDDIVMGEEGVNWYMSRGISK